MSVYTLRSDALVTLAHAKLELGVADLDTGRDDQITGLINAVTAAITAYTGREFVAASGASSVRLFDIVGTGYGAIVNLPPSQLRVASQVIVDPVLAPQTLTEGPDYRLLPVSKPNGVYDQVELYAYSFSASPLWYGPHSLQIAGTWGWPAVPDDVVRAALKAIGDWAKHDQTSFAAQYPDQSGPLDQDTSGGLPWGALRLLKPYRRIVG